LLNMFFFWNCRQDDMIHQTDFLSWVELIGSDRIESNRTGQDGMGSDMMWYDMIESLLLI
jgi:hypothetical protein